MLFSYFQSRPLLLKVIYLIALIIGVVGYSRMPRNMYPDVERPQVLITTQLPGASALAIAQRVTRPIEQELHGLRQIREVQSINKNEVSIVRAEFEYGKGQDGALLDINNALSKIRARLPADALPSSVQAVGAFTRPVMVITLSPAEGSALTLSALRMLAENDIRAALVTLPGIANTEIFGGYEPTVRVELDPFQLARYRLSLTQVQDLITKTNQDWPVGAFRGDNTHLTLTIPGERADIGHLRAMPLQGDVTLGDVADIRLAHADRLSAYHGNGQPGIAVAVLRAPGEPVETALNSAQQGLSALMARYPLVKFDVSESQKDLIDVSSQGMNRALLDAIAFTCIVMLIFIGNWRAVVSALLCLPIVFLMTAAVLWLAGKEMNILVMTGIILAMGMLVDDAVVVLENIERHIKDKLQPVNEAIWSGTREVLSPLLIGTLATVAVLSPLMFVGDFPQQVFQHLILTVVIAVVISYFVSVTFIPRLCAFWFRHGVPEPDRLERFMGGVYRRGILPGANLYTGLLRWGLGGTLVKKLALILLPLLLLVVSARAVVPLIGREAMPPMDTGDVRAVVRFGSNASVSVAEDRLRALEAQLMQDPRVNRVSIIFGSEPGVVSMGSGQLPAEATINIAYVTRFERGESTWELEAALRRQILALPGVTAANVFSSGATALSTIKAPVDLRLSADDWRQLPAAARAVEEALDQVGGLTSVSSTWDDYTQEISLRLDEIKLRALGMTPAYVHAQLPLKGPMLSGFSKLTAAGALPIRAYFTEPFRSNPHALSLLPIQRPDGDTVPLGEIGYLSRQPGVAMLSTAAMRYTVDVYGYRDTAPISILSERAQDAARAVLPPGVDMEDKGDHDAGTQASSRMMAGLGIGILLLFGVLVPAYGSMSLALLSLLILPLSAIGAIWALLAFDKALGMPALLGMVLLCSIIIKNSVLMVDFIQHRRAHGANALQAAEGAIGLRYRPILMTAFCTIAGMLPIAMQGAIGLERMSPLAVVAIGGLLAGTVLSLFYLPFFYAWGAAGASIDDPAAMPVRPILQSTST